MMTNIYQIKILSINKWRGVEVYDFDLVNMLLLKFSLFENKYYCYKYLEYIFSRLQNNDDKLIELNKF